MCACYRAQDTWGIVKHATVAGVLSTLKGEVSSGAVSVKRRYKMARNNVKWVVCWWLVVMGEESVLGDLKRNWNLVTM